MKSIFYQDRTTRTWVKLIKVKWYQTKVVIVCKVAHWDGGLYRLRWSQPQHVHLMNISQLPVAWTEVCRCAYW